MTKGAATRARILDHAFRLAGREGVRGVTLGTLASQLGLSKSGLFAHFRTKEELSVEVLRVAAERFTDSVIRPAIAAPRGEPRIREMFENWLAWASDPAMPGGCPFVAASVEFDDQPGAPRDFLVESQSQLLGSFARAASIAVAERHFRPDLDTDQFAFELLGILFVFHHHLRLLRDERAATRARDAFERLLATSRSRSEVAPIPLGGGGASEISRSAEGR